MKKTLFLSIVLALFFGGCFSFQSINPLSDKKEDLSKKEIEIPSNAPLWLEEKTVKDHISAIGVTKIKEGQDEAFTKNRALIVAGNNLLKKVYSKTITLYKNYIEKLKDPNIFEKDVKKFAEHIALKALTLSKVNNSWTSEEENELFVQVAVDSQKVAELIQHNAKLLFESDKMLYHNFLSNRAKKDIIKEIEKED